VAERKAKTGRNTTKRQTKPLATRLEAKTAPPGPRGCMMFTGFRDRRGYGYIGQGRAGLRPILAHRAAWEVAKGAIPQGMHVLHKCDNPSCVNPAHLELGTAADNMRSKVARGRQPRGGLVHNAKLALDEVRAILADSRSNSAIGRAYGVSTATVGEIKRREIWKHVGAQPAPDPQPAPKHGSPSAPYSVRRKSLAERLQEKTAAPDANGCMIFIGAKARSGHGHIFKNAKDKSYGAHRLAWELKHGPIPNGMVVCHSCDVPACVNVDHLWLGTHDDNMEDKARKGRAYRMQGIDHPLAKLTPERVRAIRADSRPHAAIAAQYGVDRSLIYLVKRRKAWAHVA
jgi:hypothetical protein